MAAHGALFGEGLQQNNPQFLTATKLETPSTAEKWILLLTMNLHTKIPA
jgi:hypothetical protein